MLRYLAKKLGIFILFMLLLSLFSFSLSRLAPGDPLQSFYGEAVERMSPAEHEAARERLGLNAPLPVQYRTWFTQALQGDFGMSFKYKQPALQVIQSLIGNTLLLGTLAYVLVFLFAIGTAILCVLHEGTWFDRSLCQAGTLAFYLPAFWVGLLLILLFSVNLHLLPSGGAYTAGYADDIPDRIRHLILPLIVMIGSHLWYYAYMIRNKLLDEVRKDYVLFAKSKGLSRLQILCRHCLRNIAPTIVSIMAISVTHILSGTYVVEFVFAYPGIGALAVESAKYHDYNLLMLIVLLTGALVILTSLAAETINECIDPRMRVQEAALWKKTSRTL